MAPDRPDDGAELPNVARHAFGGPVFLTCAAFFIAVSTLLVSLMLEPMFMTNDDAALSMIGSGYGISPHPEAHLVFAHYGYGLILTFFSRFMGPVTHGWITLACLTLCLFFLVDRVVRFSRSKTTAFLWAGILVCIFCGAMVEPQFTLTAALLFATAIALYFPAQGPEERSSLFYCLVVLLLSLCLLLRIAEFVMGAVIVSPLLLSLVWGRRKQNRMAQVLLGTIIVIGGVGYLTDQLAYQLSGSWSHAMQYNVLRSQFMDFGRVPWIANSPAYEKVGWTYNDYRMFSSFYAAASIFDMDKLTYLVGKVGIPASSFDWAWVRDWFYYPIISPPLFLSLTAQIVITIIDSQGRRLNLLLVIGECAAIFISAVTGRSPLFRLWISVTDTVLICMVANFLPTSGRDARALGGLLCVVLVLCLEVLASQLISHQKNRDDARRYRSWINAHSDFFTGKMVTWGGKLYFEYLITPTRVYFPLPQTDMVPIGALSRTPITPAAMSAVGITDLSDALCMQRGVHLIAGPDLLASLTQFCVQHEGHAPVYRTVSTFENTALYLSED